MRARLVRWLLEAAEEVLASRPVISTCCAQCRCPILLQTLGHRCKKTSLDHEGRAETLIITGNEFGGIRWIKERKGKECFMRINPYKMYNSARIRKPPEDIKQLELGSTSSSDRQRQPALMEDHGTVEGRNRAPPVQWHWSALDNVCRFSTVSLRLTK